MKKTMTLRGTLTAADASLSTNNNIFTYESPDLTSAWIVKEFLFWPASLRANTGSTEGQYTVSANLATDTIGGSTFNSIGSVADNRTIGWLVRGFNIRNEGSDDFLAAPTGMESNYGYVDPDHVVNRQLFVNFTSNTDSSTKPEREWNYIVRLEKISITENQAVLAMIKSTAQNIDS
jgi:hypothetical protein|tara:strand:+ start:1022 stop:1552 length:531 start_codon:yes stop_codon:yes gene_type:complete